MQGLGIITGSAVMGGAAPQVLPGKPTPGTGISPKWAMGEVCEPLNPTWVIPGGFLHFPSAEERPKVLEKPNP